jgi:hypothetical protein
MLPLYSDSNPQGTQLCSGAASIPDNSAGYTTPIGGGIPSPNVWLKANYVVQDTGALMWLCGSRGPLLFPEYVALVPALSAFAAVVSVMRSCGVYSVVHATASTCDGSLVYCAFGVMLSLCE